MEKGKFTAVSCGGAAMIIRFNNTDCAYRRGNTRVGEGVQGTQYTKDDPDNPHKLAERHRAISAKCYSREKNK